MFLAILYQFLRYRCNINPIVSADIRADIAGFDGDIDHVDTKIIGGYRY